MRISDWSSDVCSSDLVVGIELQRDRKIAADRATCRADGFDQHARAVLQRAAPGVAALIGDRRQERAEQIAVRGMDLHAGEAGCARGGRDAREAFDEIDNLVFRSEEHTSELKSLMRISYAVVC